MSIVTILLFGPPRLLRGGQPVPIERRKALALAAYLALAESPRPRDELAALFWPELSQERARGALRSTLPALTAAAPSAWLATDRSTVALRPEAVSVDARRFAGLVAAARAHHADNTPLCAACAARLREADALYLDDFLASFNLPACPDFEAWQLAHREALRQDFGWVLHALGGQGLSAGQGAADASLGYARRLVELDPLNEEAQRLLMRLYAAAGRRGEALRQYHACASLLRAELGVAPATETAALFEQLTHDEAAAPPTPGAGLPAEAGVFIGREAELAHIVALLGDPACRLLTITGPGGSGKTRLALRAAAALAPSRREGAHLVALAEAHTLDEAANLIAQALGVAVEVGARPRAALRAALARRELLLVLDNLEQVAGMADLLPELLAAAPGLILLATSRERLALRAEAVLPLEGLPFPEPGDDEPANYEAVRLFVARARQVRPDFALTVASQMAVARICALAGGMPLGIELAAAWARTLSPQEIAAAIERSPDFLRAAVRDLPQRHRSLRAVFEHSWGLLAPTERAAFQRLAVFRGSFSAEAASAIAGVSLDELAALGDKSLLRQSAGGRYNFHALLREYAAERLAESPADEAALRASHGRYIAALVERYASDLLGAGQRDALAALAREGPNLRAAWEWAVATNDGTAMAAMLDGLARFCELRNYRQECERALESAAARLADPPPSDTAAHRLLARVLAWLGHFRQFLGRYDASDEALAAARASAADLGDAGLLAFCAKGQGINANARGDHRRAITLYAESLAIAEGLGDRSGVGEALNRMGGAAYDMGEMAEARRCWQASYEAYAGLGDLSGMARALNNLGEVCRVTGAYSESRLLSERSLALQAESGPGWSVHPRNNLALLARAEGRLDEARRLHERSLVICRAIGDARGTANTTFFLGELELAAGRLAAAEEYLATSLRDFRALGQRQGVTAGLTALAELALRGGAHGEAAALAREALAIAEAIPARLHMGRAQSTLGLALALGGEPAAAAAALASAEATLTTLGAIPDARLAAERRQALGR